MATNPKLGPILVAPETPILEAIEVLNAAGKRIILIAEDDLKLLGVVTDSNIRHAILDHIDLQEPISAIMRAKPITVLPHYQNDEVLGLMRQTLCHQIPVIDAEQRLIDIHFLDDLLADRPTGTPKTAVIMVGGLGTRLHPLTKETPKPLLVIGDKPLLFTILEQLLAAGVEQIYLTLNYKRDVIKRAIEAVPRYRDAVRFLDEFKRLGTAGPLSLLEPHPDAPIIVMNGDLLTKVNLAEMFRFHQHERNVMTVALREEQVEIPYGVAQLEGTRLIGLVEKPKYTHFINAGIYIIEPYVLDRVPKDTFFDMNTLIQDLIDVDLRVGSFPVHEYWIDIGRHEQLEQAQKDYPNLFNK